MLHKSSFRAEQRIKLPHDCRPGNTTTCRAGALCVDAGRDFTGRINGNTIEGTVKGATSGAWNATRVGGKPAPAK